MLEAFLSRDASFDGVFVTAVHTTGIFCRPTCPAKKPRPENLSFFGSSSEAMLSGYRPCKRCRPLEERGSAPGWLQPLLDEVDADPSRRWTDRELQARGWSPGRVRRWFQRNHGMTFHAYHRARRLASAMDQVREGRAVSRAAFESGYDSLSGFQEAFRRVFGAPPTETARATVIQVDRVTTPLGPMLLGATDEALCLAEFTDRPRLLRQMERVRDGLDAVLVTGRNDVVEKAADQLGGYFSGRRRRFDVPLAPVGTVFQRAVWDELQRIPFGEVRSYGDVAASLGRPAAVRAVGKANGDNALAVLIPCHRVVGSDGRLVGYGGGLWRKRRLLELEQRAVGTGSDEAAGMGTG
ncbi:MAG: methylated-DNA--[protein]-cysteine S-methyltransferase [Gemmatimonadota bacterium]